MTRDSVILYSQLVILYIRDSGNEALSVNLLDDERSPNSH